MNQADISRLVSQLKITLHPRRRLRNPEGPYGRLKKLRATVTALFKHERIEMYYDHVDEARGYAERLISEAIRYGDHHRPTMEMADFWLDEKQLVHKLFKVLVPRFQNYTTSYTRMHKAPRVYPGSRIERAVLELKENPYPSLMPDLANNRYLIHNVLLDEARKEYQTEKYLKIAEAMKVSHPATTTDGEQLDAMSKNQDVDSPAASVDGEQSESTSKNQESSTCETVESCATLVDGEQSEATNKNQEQSRHESLGGGHKPSTADSSDAVQDIKSSSSNPEKT